MEAHHPHHVTHKKKWAEYLLEFFMLFLAVFLGFIAENIRENSIERHREKQYVKSLIEDLNEDKTILEKQIVQQRTSIGMMDSMIIILNEPSLISENGSALYFFARLAPRHRSLTINMRTFEQLKNSGNFRLISTLETSNRIMSYYEKIPPILQLQDIYSKEFVDYKKLAAKIFEPTVFIRLENEKSEIVRATDNPSLRKVPYDLIKELAVYSIYMNGSRKIILSYEKDVLDYANELIGYLQKEYHLE